jgi:hypothetical protein
LQYLHDIKANATLLRGAVKSADAETEKANGATTINVEADFTAALDNDTTRQAGLELRGLLRSRLGNLTGALRDFEVLVENASAGSIQHARALRHQADALRIQAGGPKSLRDARRLLNEPYGVFHDGRTLSDEDSLELGFNRESYGEVQAALAAHAGSDNEKAIRALNEAVGYFVSLGPSGEPHRVRVQNRVRALTGPTASQ